MTMPSDKKRIIKAWLLRAEHNEPMMIEIEYHGFCKCYDFNGEGLAITTRKPGGDFAGNITPVEIHLPHTKPKTHK